MSEYSDYSNSTGQILGFTGAELWLRRPGQYRKSRRSVARRGRRFLTNLVCFVASIAVRMACQHYARPADSSWMSSISGWSTAVASMWFGILVIRDLLVAGSTVCLEMMSPAEPTTALLDEPKQAVVDAAPNVSDTGKPPAIPSLILELLIPIRDRQSVIGDLQEAYSKDMLPAYGRQTAAFLYSWDCIKEAVYYSMPRLKKAIPLGIVTAVIWHWYSWIARFFFKH